MIEVKIHDSELASAAKQGADAFLELIIDRTRKAIGGELNADNMAQMSSKQITLIGYATLRDELMDGGFVQLIHNGYGPFFFKNLFDLAVKQWGLNELCLLMRHAKKSYQKHRDEIEVELTDEEFMALFEKYSDFDDLDDAFVEHEEEWTAEIAEYIDQHIDSFAVVR